MSPIPTLAEIPTDICLSSTAHTSAVRGTIPASSAGYSEATPGSVLLLKFIARSALPANPSNTHIGATVLVTPSTTIRNVTTTLSESIRMNHDRSISVLFSVMICLVQSHPLNTFKRVLNQEGVRIKTKKSVSSFEAYPVGLDEVCASDLIQHVLHDEVGQQVCGVAVLDRVL
jgi:hypothetical protein